MDWNCIKLITFVLLKVVIMSKSTISFRVKERAKVSPSLSGLSEWIEGVIIKIFKNPFLGEELAVQDENGRIFYGEKKYFKKA